MCDPVTMAVAQFAVAAAGTASSYSAAKSEAGAAQATYDQNVKNTEQAQKANHRSLSSRVQQEDQAALQAAQSQEIEAAQTAATIEVSAGESNLSGNSVGNLLRGVYGTLGRNQTTLAANSDARREASTVELENIDIAAKNQINSMPQPTKPSLTPYLIKGFSDGLSSYNSYQKRKAT